MLIGTAGAAMTATGLAVLTVPLTASGQGQRFNYENFNGKTPDHYDLTGATLNIVACAPEATGGDLSIFFTTNARIDSPMFNVPLSALTSGFQTISIQVPDATPNGYDPSIIFVIRLEVEAGAAFGSSWQTPASVVYIDSISTSDGTFNDTFEIAVDYGVLAKSDARAGSGTVTWVSSYTVQGSTGGATSTSQGGAGGVAGDGGAPNAGGSSALTVTGGSSNSASGGGLAAGTGGMNEAGGTAASSATGGAGGTGGASGT